MGYDNAQTDKVEVFSKANSINDVPEVDEKWEVGSILWDITAKKLYMLNTAGTWVEQ
jgi:hypothetical protein